MTIGGRDIGGWVLVGLAVIFDLFEILVEFATTALGVVAAGTVGGCAIGAHYAGQTGCAVGAAIGGFIGVLANWVGAGEVAGAIVGYVLDVGFSIAAFALLLSFLILTKRMTFSRWLFISGTLFAKLIPIINIAPAWSACTWSCSKKQNTQTQQQSYEPQTA